MMSAMTGRPKWETLLGELQGQIESGMKPGDALPSERELMSRHGVSRMTVRHTLSMLATRGFVHRVQGAGTFVSDRTMVSKTLTLTSFSEDIRARGMVPGSREVLRQVIPAPSDVATDLGLSLGHLVQFLERVRTADEVSMCLERVWLPATLVGDSLHAVAEVGSLYDRLETWGMAPVRADQSVTADHFTDYEADLLGVPGSSPCLRVARVSYDSRGRAVERGISAYRADRYEFRFGVSRVAGP